MLRGIIVVAFACLIGACTTTAVEPAADAAAQAAPALAAPHAKAGHHHRAMTPQVEACQDACWADIPFNACRTQRDGCLAAATDEAGQRHCRQMSRTCRKTRHACLKGCWSDPVPHLQPPVAAEAAADEPEADADGAL